MDDHCTVFSLGPENLGPDRGGHCRELKKKKIEVNFHLKFESLVIYDSLHYLILRYLVPKFIYIKKKQYLGNRQTTSGRGLQIFIHLTFMCPNISFGL